jgi:hypothetical protein
MGVLDTLKNGAVKGLKSVGNTTSKAVSNSTNRAIESVISKSITAVGNKATDAVLKDINSPKAAPKPNPAPTPAPAASAGAKAEPKQLSPAELEAIIEARVRERKMSSDWKFSIVDLMKAFSMDSSLDSRKALAVRLNYFGYDADGSAEKDKWLHAELLKAIAQNGGAMPSYLL